MNSTNPQAPEEPRDEDSERRMADSSLERATMELEHPYTIFTPGAVACILILVAISSLISPLGSTTYFPALNALADELHVTAAKVNLSITTYMIAQAIAPSVIGGMSDDSGRRLSFVTCFVLFSLANVGLALQSNYVALLILRMLQAAGCSASVALSVAVVADISTSADRGRYMGLATSGALLGPSLGPTIGGLLTEIYGWQSIFWFLLIFTITLAAVFIPLFPETCRRVVGNGSIPARGVNRSIIGHFQCRRYAEWHNSHVVEGAIAQNGTSNFGLANPLRSIKILLEKESCIIIVYNGILYLGIEVVTASLPYLYQQTYGLNTLQVGLCYISMGVGSLLSSLSMGQVADWNFRRHARHLGRPTNKNRKEDLNGFPIEMARMQIAFPGHIITTVAVAAFGWTIQYRASIVGAEAALFFVGFGISTTFNLTNTLLIDLHQEKPATATATVNFVRCLLSAGGAAAIIPMINAMGTGWAFSVFALIFVLSSPAVFLLMKKGQRWRTSASEVIRTEKHECPSVSGHAPQSLVLRGEPYAQVRP